MRPLVNLSVAQDCLFDHVVRLGLTSGSVARDAAVERAIGIENYLNSKVDQILTGMVFRNLQTLPSCSVDKIVDTDCAPEPAMTVFIRIFRQLKDEDWRAGLS